MFPSRYFADRYFAPRYFPKVGADQVGQTGPLVGRWENVVYLESSPQRTSLQAAPIGRLNLEAKDSNG